MSDRKFQLGTVGVVAVLLIVSVFMVLFYSWVSADAPYYLATARDLSEGKVLYKEIRSGYTPFVMVFFSCVFLFLKTPQFITFMLVHISVILLTGAILFYILRYLKLDIVLSGVLAAIFCLAILSSDGNYLVLESYSVFFVLLAILFLLRDKGYFLMGVFLGCSFLCKQYGVLNFIPFFFYILMAEKSISQRLKKGVEFGLGGIAVFAVFMAYYIVLKEVDSRELLLQISGREYSAIYVEREKSILSMLIGAKVFILFAIIPLLYVVREKKISLELKFCAIGVLACLIPVYLRGFQHYYINTFPYVFLAIGIVLTTVAKQRFYIVLATASAIVASGLLIARVIRYSERKNEQLEMASIISEEIPVGSYVFINGELRYLYILNNYKNPLLNTIGYSYLFDDMSQLNKLPDILLTSESVTIENMNAKEIKTKWGNMYIYRKIAD